MDVNTYFTPVKTTLFVTPYNMNQVPAAKRNNGLVVTEDFEFNGLRVQAGTPIVVTNSRRYNRGVYCK